MFMGRVTITDDKLYADIVEYCKLNNERIGEFCTRLLKGAFAVEVYGDVPFGFVVAEYPKEKGEAVEPKNEPINEPIVAETEEKTIEKNVAELEKQAQEVIDEHMRLLKEKNEKPRKRRL